MRFRPPDLITFTISLPRAGMFDEYIEALKTQRQAMIDARNPEAAQALHTLICLAEAGMHYLNTSTTAPIIFGKR